jgi:hypothetical protein
MYGRAIDVGYSKMILSADDGYFVLSNLPLGTYKVTITKSGFSPLNYDDITLNAGKEAVLDARLVVGSAATSVDVTATISNIDPSTLNEWIRRWQDATAYPYFANKALPRRTSH